MKVLCFLLCFLVVAFSLSKGWCSSTVAKQLHHIPYNDRKKIEDLFQYLIWDSLFAFALFGDKPVSTACYLKTISSPLQLINHSNFCFSLYHYWKLWEKYRHLFPMKNYLLLGQENHEWLQITLVNRKACMKTIQNNLLLFQQKLNRKLNAEEIFHCITEKKLLQDNLNQSHCLCGILYGFEKESCIKFDEFYSTHLFSEKKFESFHQEHPLTPLKLKLPYFTVFSKSAEVEYLKREYSTQRETICKIYSQGDFLETTLQKLMEE